ncbi:hypothetical protein NQ317_014498 [Molorchus minor]|uniref:Uncharacterized protein n=1 Tax=Molorchus minor TaxID=1323400 RepID=A0ABQ9JYB7_9CUCU|nr:hypothetical protein NQ317_014498 [Molorchus minor]
MTFVLLKTMIPRVINNIPKLVEIGEPISRTHKMTYCSTLALRLGYSWSVYYRSSSSDSTGRKASTRAYITWRPMALSHCQPSLAKLSFSKSCFYFEGTKRRSSSENK